MRWDKRFLRKTDTSCIKGLDRMLSEEAATWWAGEDERVELPLFRQLDWESDKWVYYRWDRNSDPVEIGGDQDVAEEIEDMYESFEAEYGSFDGEDE